MRFDRKKFFDGIKARIDSTLEQSQVDGLNFLLEHFEADPLWSDIRHIAYAFATTAHETAFSFQPVEEGYYLEEKHGKAFLLKFQKGLRYAPYFGRGYVQLTWESAKIKNYSKATRELRKQKPSLVAQFEAETGKVFDLVKNPEQAMHPLIAFAVLTLGMFQGWFTGKKLATYIHGATCDYINARRIINGTDKAGPIAQLARRFEEILRASLIDSAAPPTPAIPDPQTASKEPGGKSDTAAEAPAPSAPPAGSSELIAVAATDTQAAVIDAAAALPTTHVEAKTQTGFLSKIGAFFTLVFTGQYVIPQGIQDGIANPTIWEKVGLFLNKYGLWILGAVALWFVVNKIEGAIMKSSVAATNADPTKGAIQLTQTPGLFEKARGLFK
jgi:hypothetical protein